MWPFKWNKDERVQEQQHKRAFLKLGRLHRILGNLRAMIQRRIVLHYEWGLLRNATERDFEQVCIVMSKVTHE